MSKEQEIARLRTTLSLDTGDFKKELASVNKQTNGLKKSFDIANKSIANAEDKMEATTKAIAKGEKAMESMNKKLDLQNTRYNDLKNTIDRQSRSYEELGTELNQAERELENLKKAENKSTEAIERQQRAVEDLKRKLSDKAQVIDKNINKLQTYSNDIDKTENDITSLGSQLNNLSQSLEENANATGDSAGNLSEFVGLADNAGVNLSLLELGAKGAALAIAGVITSKVIEGAGSYDKAITDLQITMGYTEEQAQDLLRTINRFSDGGYNIENISEAIQMLETRFGLGTEKSEELAQGMALLNDYGYENKDIIRFMTTGVNDWGMKHEEVLDYILKGEQEGLNMSEDWMDTLTEYAPIFSTMGITSSDAFQLISKGMQATGVDSDKSADMVKEFFLTLTDGSTASKETFKELGLNIDQMNKDIDNGSLTSTEAMAKVSKAIMGVSSDTDRARLLTEVFKGTVEYGSDGIVEAWANVDGSIANTTGTMDEARATYENSYEAMKKDLSQSWDKLTQKIGGKVIPILKDVVDSLLSMPFEMEVAGTRLSMSWDDVCNYLDNGWQGFVGFFQDGIARILSSSSEVARALGQDGLANDIKKSADSMKKAHDETVAKIKRNKEEITKSEDQQNRLMNELLTGTLEEKKAKYDEIMGYTNKTKENETQKTKTESEKQTQKTKEEAQKQKNSKIDESKKAKDGVGKNNEETTKKAQAEAKKTKEALDSITMDGSLKTLQAQATQMYKGVKTSFYMMEKTTKQHATNMYKGVTTSTQVMSNKARQDGTSMYKGVTTSARKMCDSAKQSATNMYKGVATSTYKMKNKAISDWEAIKDAYSKGIRGKVTTTHTKINVSKENENTRSLKSIRSMRSILPRVEKAGAYYNSNTTQSIGFSRAVNQNPNQSFISEINKLNKKIDNKTKTRDKNIHLELPIKLEGKEIARVTAKYINDELQIINTRNSRNRGNY
ncbi:phage tail tape measure protein [Terrisporobacter sp.]|uniref:phage tail tape measure protein n=1 Tax=Terrisporobacter sp. TaxID=1965305 RepID=UPI0028A12735|nr:phage tail tape measure protein [Terrisporobacter sp.]